MLFVLTLLYLVEGRCVVDGLRTIYTRDVKIVPVGRGWSKDVRLSTEIFV